MAITLTDLKNATASYIDDEVVVTIPRITDDLEPDEDGSFDVVVTNGTATTGFRLDDVVLHVRSQNPGRAKLVVPQAALLVPRATTDPDGPELAGNSLVNEMFIFFQEGDFAPNTRLEPGEVLEIELQYHAEVPGAVTIACDVHATVDVDGLFPRQSGDAAAASVRIRP